MLPLSGIHLELHVGFCYCYILEIRKVVYTKKTSSCNTPAKLDAILWCDQHGLVINAHTGFKQHMPDKSLISCKQLCCSDFLDVRLKRNLDSILLLVAFGISYICYLPVKLFLGI